jgi:molybdopterin converting factor small subunit
MLLNVELSGFPDLRRAAGAKTFTVTIDGNTFGDLLSHMEQTYGETLRKSWMDDQGKLGFHVRVMLNGKENISRDDLTYPLADRDRVTFLMMITGG